MPTPPVCVPLRVSQRMALGTRVRAWLRKGWVMGRASDVLWPDPHRPLTTSSLGALSGPQFPCLWTEDMQIAILHCPLRRHYASWLHASWPDFGNILVAPGVMTSDLQLCRRESNQMCGHPVGPDLKESLPWGIPWGRDGDSISHGWVRAWGLRPIVLPS